MAKEKPSGKSATSVEFEVLMEFQRHVKNHFDRSRIPWFNSAVSTMAQQLNTTPNEVMKQALEDFDQFINQVEKSVGPVPSSEDIADADAEAEPDDDALDDFDKLLDDE